MCSMSVVMDYGRTAWPNLTSPNWHVGNPVIPVPPQQEKAALDAFVELARKAAEFDKLAAQPHCEDPEKAKLLECILERLEAIEQKLALA